MYIVQDIVPALILLDHEELQKCTLRTSVAEREGRKLTHLSTIVTGYVQSTIFAEYEPNRTDAGARTRCQVCRYNHEGVVL